MSCMFQWISFGYFSELSGLSASLGWAVCAYQFPRWFGSFNGLAGLCISVYCVRLGVLWRFSRLVVMGVSLVWVMKYMYIFLDQRFTNHVHVASYPTVSSHFDIYTTKCASM